ncbi:MAG: hypothetical protein K8R35_01985 [Bacteroidales bacterium]|nr:hypothetical protein [Bacteroidales bacterium]
MKKNGTLINLSSLIVIVLFFELVKLNRWNPQLLVYETIPFLVLLISYIKYFGKTGLWRLVHTSSDKLDCKKNLLITSAIKTAYSIYTIMVLVILFVNVLSGIEISMVLVVALIYLAHILPAYILLWTK